MKYFKDYKGEIFRKHNGVWERYDKKQNKWHESVWFVGANIKELTEKEAFIELL